MSIVKTQTLRTHRPQSPPLCSLNTLRSLTEFLEQTCLAHGDCNGRTTLRRPPWTVTMTTLHLMNWSEKSKSGYSTCATVQWYSTPLQQPNVSSALTHHQSEDTCVLTQHCFLTLTVPIYKKECRELLLHCCTEHNIDYLTDNRHKQQQQPLWVESWQSSLGYICISLLTEHRCV